MASFVHPTPIGPETGVSKLCHPSRSWTSALGEVGADHFCMMKTLTQLRLIPLDIFIDFVKQFERFYWCQGVDRSLCSPLWNAAWICMCHNLDDCLIVGIIWASGEYCGGSGYLIVRRDVVFDFPRDCSTVAVLLTICAPESIGSAGLSIFFLVICRIVRMIHGLVDHHFSTVPLPSMVAKCDEVSRFQKEDLWRLAPA